MTYAERNRNRLTNNPKSPKSRKNPPERSYKNAKTLAKNKIPPITKKISNMANQFADFIFLCYLFKNDIIFGFGVKI